MVSPYLLKFSIIKYLAIVGILPYFSRWQLLLNITTRLTNTNTTQHIPFYSTSKFPFYYFFVPSSLFHASHRSMVGSQTNANSNPHKTNSRTGNIKPTTGHISALDFGYGSSDDHR